MKNTPQGISIRKAALYLAVGALISLFGYLALAKMGVVPTYQCSSTMGTNGPVSWCFWAKGTLVG